MTLMACLRRWAASLLLLASAACASSELAPGDSIEPISLSAYRVGPGDQLRINVFGQPTLSGTFLINANGAIVYPLIGDVSAQGMTTNEFAAALTEALQDGYVRQPSITVEVSAYRPFFVMGEVGAPGSYPYTEGLTVMNAVAMSGGFSYRADIRRVFIKHAGDTAEREYRLTVNTPIMPGDTVRIPERRF